MLYGFSWCWGQGRSTGDGCAGNPCGTCPLRRSPFRSCSGTYGSGSNWWGCSFLGSFLGTAITDAYFYLIDVIPHWRAIMYLEGDVISVQEMLAQAIAQAQTFSGQVWGFS